MAMPLLWAGLLWEANARLSALWAAYLVAAMAFTLASTGWAWTR
jgi:hypothetical protein